MHDIYSQATFCITSCYPGIPTRGSFDLKSESGNYIEFYFTDCTTCLIDGGVNENRPNTEEFMQYLPWFLTSNPDSTTCNQG